MRNNQEKNLLLIQLNELNFDYHLESEQKPIYIRVIEYIENYLTEFNL